MNDEELKEYADKLYKEWAEKHSWHWVNKWLRRNKYRMNSCETKEFAEYMMDGFIRWVTRDK